MNFFITILGSGAALPAHHRHCSSQVVNIHGFRMLLDCGESTQNQLRHTHQRLQSMGVIFLSHLHGDHFFGLPGLLASMSLCGRTEPVQLFAPQGIKEALEVLLAASSTYLQYELQIHEMTHSEPTEIFANKYCRVTAFPLLHTVPTYGYIFEEVRDALNLKPEARDAYNLSHEQCASIKQGNDLILEDGSVIPYQELTTPAKPPRRYAYCCDTAYGEQLIPIVRDVDLLCVDCTFDATHTQMAIERQHCTAAQCATLAKEAEAKQLLLTHFSARYKDIQVLIDEASALFPNVIAASEGAVIEIAYREAAQTQNDEKTSSKISM